MNAPLLVVLWALFCSDMYRWVWGLMLDMARQRSAPQGALDAFGVLCGMTLPYRTGFSH